MAIGDFASATIGPGPLKGYERILVGCHQSWKQAPWSERQQWPI